MPKKKGNKTIVIIVVAIAAILLLCSCCCVSVFALGFFGSLPDEWQEKYDDQDWTIKDEDDQNDEDDQDDEEDLDYPSGDVSDWWWDASEDERDAYENENGYPYTLYSFNWSASKFEDGSWYDTTSCDFPNGDIDMWWDTVDQDMRDCYMLLWGLPSFLYSGNWEESGWYKEDNCDFPNGDVEYWWDDATDAMKDCYVWTYGAPYIIYSDDFYDDWDDWDDDVNYDLSCVYEIDCDHPNGDVEYWWYDATEAQKACYISESGYPPFWQGGICDIPNGDVESWWCSTDEDTRLCYIDYYGLPWFME